MIDLIAHHFEGNPRPTVKCQKHGFVSLVDMMPRLSPNDEITTADHAVVQSARVSYGDGTKKVSADRELIRYLMRHRHTTPFEMVEFKFHCKMPIFVARQWIRHRTANVNEISGRYSVMADEFYVPDADNIRLQSTWNIQGSEGNLDEEQAQKIHKKLEEFCKHSYDTYQDLLNTGVGREQARMVLPLNLYTEWYWKIDLHNLFHFLSLRCDEHAQKEIQEYGNAMLGLISPVVPLCVEAWNDYHPLRGGVMLSRLEAQAIQQPVKEHALKANNLDAKSKREQDEWTLKSKHLGFED